MPFLVTNVVRQGFSTNFNWFQEDQWVWFDKKLNCTMDDKHSLWEMQCISWDIELRFYLAMYNNARCSSWLRIVWRPYFYLPTPDSRHSSDWHETLLLSHALLRFLVPDHLHGLVRFSNWLGLEWVWEPDYYLYLPTLADGDRVTNTLLWRHWFKTVHFHEETLSSREFKIAMSCQFLLLQHFLQKVFLFPLLSDLV